MKLFRNLPGRHWRETEGSIALPHSSSALEGDRWSTPLLDGINAQKEPRYPLYSRADGPQGRSAWVPKISTPSPPGLEPRTVQPVANRYADWASSAVYVYKMYILYSKQKVDTCYSVLN